MESMKQKLVGIVGAKNVVDSPEVLEVYSKDQSFAAPMMPVMVVKPENAAKFKNWLSGQMKRKHHLYQ